MKREAKRVLITGIPYLAAGLAATKLGETWRLAEGADLSSKILGLGDAFGGAFADPLPSFHPADLLAGMAVGACLRLAVYLRGKNAKKYRHNVEYGSARWGA